jgi:putative alpha-1,2-mannosidase
MPTVGELLTVPGLPSDTIKTGYRSRFSHENEVVKPGYYSVLLDDYQIQAELTATERVAFQRFTFPQGQEKHILFNIGNRQGESGAVKDAYVVYNQDGTVEGLRKSGE